MASTRAPEIKKGMAVVIDGEIWFVMKRDHVTPGKGQALHHVNLKNLKSGNQKNLRLGSNDTVEVAYLDRKQCQYLYKDTQGFVFMDEESYDQFFLTDDVVGELMDFIKENESVQVTFHDGAPLTVDLPTSVVLELTDAEEAIRGDTATNVTKNATTETGMQVKVPAHIKAGDKVKISTEDRSFLGRVND